MATGVQSAAKAQDDCEAARVPSAGSAATLDGPTLLDAPLPVAQVALAGDAGAWDRYSREWLDELGPVGPRETRVATDIADTSWKLDKLMHVETGVIDDQIQTALAGRTKPSQDVETGKPAKRAGATPEAKAVALLLRTQRQLKCEFYRACKELDRLQSIRLANDPTHSESAPKTQRKGAAKRKPRASSAEAPASSAEANGSSALVAPAPAEAVCEWTPEPIAEPTPAPPTQASVQRNGTPVQKTVAFPRIESAGGDAAVAKTVESKPVEPTLAEPQSAAQGAATVSPQLDQTPEQIRKRDDNRRRRQAKQQKKAQRKARRRRH